MTCARATAIREAQEPNLLLRPNDPGGPAGPGGRRRGGRRFCSTRSARPTAAGATRRRSRRARARRGCAAPTSISIPKGARWRGRRPRSSASASRTRAARSPASARWRRGPGAPAGVARALMSELGEIAAGVDQRAAVPGQLQPRLVRSLHAARLRGGRRRALSARREARAARRRRPRTRRPAAGGRRPAGHRTLRSVAHGRRPAPRPRAAARRRAAGFVYRPRRRGEASPAICSFARCRRASSSAPAVAESAEMLAALVDGVAASLPGRAAVIRASAAAPADAQARVRARFSRRSPREPHGARAVHAASGPALRAVPRESL